MSAEESGHPWIGIVVGEGAGNVLRLKCARCEVILDTPLPASVSTVLSAQAKFDSAHSRCKEVLPGTIRYEERAEAFREEGREEEQRKEVEFRMAHARRLGIYEPKDSCPCWEDIFDEIERKAWMWMANDAISICSAAANGGTEPGLLVKANEIAENIRSALNARLEGPEGSKQ